MVLVLREETCKCFCERWIRKERYCCGIVRRHFSCCVVSACWRVSELQTQWTVSFCVVALFMCCYTFYVLLHFLCFVTLFMYCYTFYVLLHFLCFVTLFMCCYTFYVLLHFLCVVTLFMFCYTFYVLLHFLFSTENFTILFAFLVLSIWRCFSPFYVSRFKQSVLSHLIISPHSSFSFPPFPSHSFLSCYFICLFLCAFASPRLSVCQYARDKSAPTGRIFIKFDIWVFFENLSRKFEFC